MKILEKRPALAPISEETTANEQNRQERSGLTDNQEPKPTKDETHEQRKKVWLILNKNPFT